jgi:hypothetical protein
MNKAPGTKLQIHGERGGRDMAPQAWTVHGIGWPVIVRDTDGKLAKVARPHQHHGGVRKMTQEEKRWQRKMERKNKARTARKERKAVERAIKNAPVVNRYDIDFFRKEA